MMVEVLVLLLTTSLVSGTDIPQGVDLVESSGSLFDQELYNSVLDPELCTQHLEEMNAFNFYDVSFRIPQGISRGNALSYGLYQQCLDLRQEIAEDNVIEGKHCMISVPLTSLPPSLLYPSREELFSVPDEVAEKVFAIQRQFTPESLRRPFGVQTFQNIQTEEVSSGDTQQLLGLEFQLGVCIPKSCSVSQALDQYFNNTIVSVNNQEGFCRLPNDRPYTAGDYVAMVIFSIVILITLLSTSYEVTHTFVLNNDPQKLNKVYTCCSVYTNTRRLFTFRPAPSAISCLDGIRSISILWIISFHVVVMMTGPELENNLDHREWFWSPRAIWFLPGDISVDSFFLLSGLLLVYTSANKQTKMSLLNNLHLYYLNRFLRMFPLVATAVLLQATLMFHMGDGSNWTFMADQVFACQRYWWSALLHLQNYVNPNMRCLGHLWYLAVDFQLHLLSPLVLYWALGSRRQAWTGLTVAFLGVLTASTIFCYLIDIRETSTTYLNKYYMNTLTRAPVFLAGILYGYLLHVYRGKKLQFPTWSVVAGWTCSLTLLSLIVYSFYVTNQEGYSNDSLDNFLYSFKRTIWAIGLGLMIFVCSRGYGGPINWFLSLTVWKFISRISFAMYVFHYPIQFLKRGSVIAPFYFSEKNIFLQIQEDIVLTILVSIVACVLVDTPFSTLKEMILSEGHQKQTPKEKEVNVNGKGDLTTDSNDVIVIAEAETDVKTAKA